MTPTFVNMCIGVYLSHFHRTSQSHTRRFVVIAPGFAIIKVVSTNSILNNAKKIQSVVQDVIKGHCHRSIQLQGDDLPKPLERRGCMFILHYHIVFEVFLSVQKLW